MFGTIIRSFYRVAGHGGTRARDRALHDVERVETIGSVPITISHRHRGTDARKHTKTHEL